MNGKAGDIKAARTALTNVATNKTAFSGANKLNFSGYGQGATDFANSLAVAAGMPTTKFANGGELFTSPEGQELLAKLAP